MHTKGNYLIFDAIALCVFFKLVNNTKHKEEQKPDPTQKFQFICCWQALHLGRR